jgi:hypothetical protein
LHGKIGQKVALIHEKFLSLALFGTEKYIPMNFLAQKRRSSAVLTTSEQLADGLITINQFQYGLPKRM